MLARLFPKFQEHINDNFPFLKDAKLLIAISGGLDSVVLTHLSYKLGLNISLAHCNFNLRGAESDADETFVLELAETLDVEVFLESFNTSEYASEQKLSTQLAARELRYHWFEELATTFNFDYILTAHHADDNLETFLINLSRGTGLDGLTGIPSVNGKVIRPLLNFSRADLETYAQEEHMAWREDSSNASDKYVRNQLRHHVVPLLKEINPEFLQNFNKTQEHLKESQLIIEDQIDDIFEYVANEISPNHIQFNIEKLKSLSSPKAYLYQIFKEYGFSNWNDMVALLDAQTGKQFFSKDYVLLRDRERLILSEISKSEVKTIVIEASQLDTEIITDLGVISMGLVGEIIDATKDTIYVDKDLLNFPLTVRPWKKGDYFYPFGMQGKKKISKLLKDEKLSLRTKEKIYLLCSGPDVVWVINLRADNRFKVTKTTKQILKIKLC
ncbi:tRNA lysidine(34) synthetase TilS [Mangrovimonas sp. CR14]|uniref:tRNA lysidine(34) synthetase TilS n=1 Tax=Mangrovimonas sp. CR14 TaxID=2706120 RepID=UPI001F0E11B8|nr:tRNA lysidine(34) synthetase TilS [Mangrovimonas sp. CR14]